MALDIKKTAQFIKRCRAASGRVIRRFLGSHQGLKGQSDFAIPESLHVLIWREVRAIRILEGTSEIMRHIIARDMLRNVRRANGLIAAEPG